MLLLAASFLTMLSNLLPKASRLNVWRTCSLASFPIASEHFASCKSPASPHGFWNLTCGSTFAGLHNCCTSLFGKGCTIPIVQQVSQRAASLPLVSVHRRKQDIWQAALSRISSPSASSADWQRQKVAKSCRRPGGALLQTVPMRWQRARSCLAWCQ